MLMKVFAHGQGRGELATDYLTDETYVNRDTRPPVVHRGDLELTKKLINSLETTWKYTSGVLSWHPDDKVTPQKETELMDDFEKIAFAGLEPDQYNIFWVRHTHADHHEMHFVIPRVELSTGKAFNPCPPNWEKDFNPLCEYHNIKERWASPFDKENQRICTPSSADIKINQLKRWGIEINKDERDEIREVLINDTVKRIESGLIENREDIIKSFQELGQEFGFSISRKGKTYISINLQESDKKIRFKGGIFHEDWSLERESTDEITRRARSVTESHSRKLTKLQNQLTGIHKKRRNYNRERYKQAQREDKDTQLLHNKNLYNQPHFFHRNSHKHSYSFMGSDFNYDEENRELILRNRNPNHRKRENTQYTDNYDRIRANPPRGQSRQIHSLSAKSPSRNRLENRKSEINQADRGKINERNTRLFTASNTKNSHQKAKFYKKTISFYKKFTDKGIGFRRRAERLKKLLRDFNELLRRIEKNIPYVVRHPRKKSTLRMR